MPRWTGFAVAASVAAAVLVGAWVLGLSEEPPIAGAAFQCAPAALRELVPGVFMTYCDGRNPGVAVENGGEVRVRLSSGTVGLLVDPGRREKRLVTVETPFSDIRVKGTIFTVRLEHTIPRVGVFRGIVEVVPAVGDDVAFDVPAGYGAGLRGHETFALSKPDNTPLWQTLLAKAKETAKAPADHSRAGDPVDKASAEHPAELSAPADSGDRSGGTAGPKREHRGGIASPPAPPSRPLRTSTLVFKRLGPASSPATGSAPLPDIGRS
jgi:hypothetical protein